MLPSGFETQRTLSLPTPAASQQSSLPAQVSGSLAVSVAVKACALAINAFCFSPHSSRQPGKKCIRATSHFPWLIKDAEEHAQVLALAGAFSLLPSVLSVTVLMVPSQFDLGWSLGLGSSEPLAPSREEHFTSGSIQK